MENQISGNLEWTGYSEGTHGAGNGWKNQVCKPKEAPPISYLVKKIERFYFVLHSTTTSLSFKLLKLRAYIYADVVRFTRCVLEGQMELASPSVLLGNRDLYSFRMAPPRGQRWYRK